MAQALEPGYSKEVVPMAGPIKIKRSQERP